MLTFKEYTKVINNNELKERPVVFNILYLRRLIFGV